MKKALLTLLADFKWYRRLKGGKWYYVEMETDNTIDGIISFWTLSPDENAEVKRIENYYAESSSPGDKEQLSR